MDAFVAIGGCGGSSILGLRGRHHSQAGCLGWNQAPPAPTPAVVSVARSSPKITAPAALSGYCLAASAAFLESETKAFDEMKKCARGDTIVIPAKSASAVARLCDFSKSIVTTPDHVVCVIVTPERVSN